MPILAFWQPTSGLSLEEELIETNSVVIIKAKRVLSVLHDYTMHAFRTHEVTLHYGASN